jgi:hypothetical protein
LFYEPKGYYNLYFLKEKFKMEERNLQEMEIVENEMETYVEPENTGGSKIGVIATCAVLGALGAGAAFVWKKTKAFRKERTIKKLEKQGYTVTKLSDEITEVEAFDVEEIENVEE